MIKITHPFLGFGNMFQSVVITDFLHFLPGSAAVAPHLLVPIVAKPTPCACRYASRLPVSRLLQKSDGYQRAAPEKTRP